MGRHVNADWRVCDGLGVYCSVFYFFCVLLFSVFLGFTIPLHYSEIKISINKYIHIKPIFLRTSCVEQQFANRGLSAVFITDIRKIVFEILTG